MNGCLRKIMGLNHCFINLAWLVSVILILTGCSTMTVTTLDKDGKPTVIENFSGDAIGMISKNLQHKLVMVTTDGTFVELVVEPPTQDNPTGSIKALYASGKKVYLTIPEGFTLNKDGLEGLAKVIEATSDKAVSVTPSGVVTGGK
jgi:hypothetical protein